MGNIDESDSYFSLDLFQLDLHLFTDLGIQSSKRLIQKKDFRLIDKSSGNGNSLLLTAGKKGDVSFFETFQTYHLQHSFDFLLNDSFIYFFQIQAETDIIHNIKMWKQRIFLEYRIDLPFIWRKLGDLNAVKQHLSTAWFLKSCDDPQGCCFSTAAGSQKRKEFVFVDIQVDSPEHLLVIKIFCEIF